MWSEQSRATCTRRSSGSIRRIFTLFRMLRPAGRTERKRRRRSSTSYQRLGGGWMAPEVIFKVDGQVRTTEEYSEMRANAALDARLFDPQYWTSVHWRE